MAPDADEQPQAQEQPEPEREQEARPGYAWRAVYFALVAGLLAYLFLSDKLQLSKLSTLHHKWHWIVFGLLLLLPGYFFCTVRYFLLLKAFGVPCTLRQSFYLTMVGSFFDVASPLQGGGDIVKAFYLGREAGKGYRSLALLSIIADRFVGLFALFLFALIACLAVYSDVRGTPLLLQTSRVLMAVCSAGVVGFFIFTAPSIATSNWRAALVARLPFHQRIERVYGAIAGLRRRPGILAAILGLSLVNHLVGCIGILCLAQGLNFTSSAAETAGLAVTLEILPSLAVLPLAMFLNMFGPGGGIGAGEVAFEWLFKVMLHVNEGAELAVVFHIVLLLSRALCFPFVLMYRRHTPRHFAPLAQKV